MLDSLVQQSRDFLYNKLLSQWLKHGIHPTSGYSAESLNTDWSVKLSGRLRLLTQCRQLYTFSHAYLETNDPKWLAPLEELFNFILKHYWLQNRWIFSLDDNLHPKELHSDCYALAFVLLSFSYYYQTKGDQRALAYIEKTHVFLNSMMRSDSGGFIERYPAIKHELRRQNPHMHLLEGYIAVYKILPEERFKVSITELLNLLEAHFFNSDSASLIEFFEEDWGIHPENGIEIEPGHHFEWVWLLHQAFKIIPNPNYLKIAEALWKTAIDFGFDPNGGIYNKIHATSHAVIDAEKRIWPITEYLKALCAHRGKSGKFKPQLDAALIFLHTYYLREDGAWNEYLDENNQPKDFPLPGTTSYHLFLGLTEAINQK